MDIGLERASHKYEYCTVDCMRLCQRNIVLTCIEFFWFLSIFFTLPLLAKKNPRPETPKLTHPHRVMDEVGSSEEKKGL